MTAAEAADRLADALQLGTADDLAQVPALLEVIAQQLPQLLAEEAAEEYAAL